MRCYQPNGFTSSVVGNDCVWSRLWCDKLLPSNEIYHRPVMEFCASSYFHIHSVILSNVIMNAVCLIFNSFCSFSPVASKYFFMCIFRYYFSIWFSISLCAYLSDLSLLCAIAKLRFMNNNIFSHHQLKQRPHPFELCVMYKMHTMKCHLFDQ